MIKVKKKDAQKSTQNGVLRANDGVSDDRHKMPHNKIMMRASEKKNVKDSSGVHLT